MMSTFFVQGRSRMLAGSLLRPNCPSLQSFRTTRARESLGWVAGILAEVSLVEFRPASVPEVRFDRLNEHYPRVVELSRLILRHGAFESRRGQLRASGFLVDMNVLFQEFLTHALREALGVSGRTLRSDSGVRGLTLDNEQRVTLKPDLTWWDGPACTFVGDAKYKNLTGEHIPNADLYQMLSYATVLDLPGGLLVYAQGEVDAATYNVRNSGRRLEIAPLDLSGTLDQALSRVRGIAEKILALRQEAHTGSHPRMPLVTSPTTTPGMRPHRRPATALQPLQPGQGNRPQEYLIAKQCGPGIPAQKRAIKRATQEAPESCRCHTLTASRPKPF